MEAVPAVARISNPRSASRLTGKITKRLSRFATEMKTVPLVGSGPKPATWLLAKAVPKPMSRPMTSPVDFISGPRMMSTDIPSTVRNRLKGITASLTAIGADVSSVEPSLSRRRRPSPRSSAMVAPSMTRDAALASGVAVALETNGTGRARIGLQDVERVPGQRELDVDQPPDSDPAGDRLGGAADPVHHLGAQRDRRECAGRVAGVDPGLLDVLHHPAEVELGPVVKRVDVDFDRVVEEPVHQHGVGWRYLGSPGDVGRKSRFVVDDLHASATEHVRRPHQHRIADVVRNGSSVLERPRQPVLGGWQLFGCQHLAECASLLGQMDGLRAGSDD